MSKVRNGLPVRLPAQEHKKANRRTTALSRGCHQFNDGMSFHSVYFSWHNTAHAIYSAIPKRKETIANRESWRAYGNQKLGFYIGNVHCPHKPARSAVRNRGFTTGVSGVLIAQPSMRWKRCIAPDCHILLGSK